MPTRTFSVADYTSTFQGYESGPGVFGLPAPTINIISIVDFELAVSGVGPLLNLSNTVYNSAFDVDFDRLVLPVPDGAIISKITYTRTFFNSIIASSPVGSGFGLAIVNFFPCNEAQAPTFPVAEANPVNYNTGTGVDDTIVEEIGEDTFIALFGTTTCTKDQLIANFTSNIIQLITQGIAINNSTPADASLDIALRSVSYEIEITYTDEPFHFTIDTPTPVDPSVTTPITIIDTPAEALLDTVTEVIINYIDEDGTPVEISILPPFIVISSTLLTFLLPVMPGSPITYTVSIVGTGFSGTVLLGTLATIFFNGGSGIYRLVVGQKFDTCYVNPTEDPELALGDSVDVNIPDPFGKTGFIGG